MTNNIVQHFYDIIRQEKGERGENTSSSTSFRGDRPLSDQPFCVYVYEVLSTCIFYVIGFFHAEAKLFCGLSLITPRTIHHAPQTVHKPNQHQTIAPSDSETERELYCRGEKADRHKYPIHTQGVRAAAP